MAKRKGVRTVAKSKAPKRKTWYTLRGKIAEDKKRGLSVVGMARKHGLTMDEVKQAVSYNRG